MDPTHFSAARHHYQQTAEFLLDGRALVTFPEINKTDLEAFRDTYGASAMYAVTYIVSSAPMALNLPPSEPRTSQNISDDFAAHTLRVSVSRPALPPGTS